MPLILTRKKHETLKIGDNIYVTVLQINKTGNIKLGIAAPKEINVARIEIPIQQLGYRVKPQLELTEKEKKLNEL